MPFAKSLRLALCAGALLTACSFTTDPASVMNGTYSLERSTGNGPVAGTLILTAKGYAERRVRYRESAGHLSEEYLTRGSAVLQPDSTIDLQLREMNLTTALPWTPNARLIEDGVEISYLDPLDGTEIVEEYRRH